eukprot:181738-Rhodomonas_salina.1
MLLPASHRRDQVTSLSPYAPAMPYAADMPYAPAMPYAGCWRSLSCYTTCAVLLYRTALCSARFASSPCCFRQSIWCYAQLCILCSALYQRSIWCYARFCTDARSCGTSEGMLPEDEIRRVVFCAGR